VLTWIVAPRARVQLADKYAGARRAIAESFELNYRCYGYRRVQAAFGRKCMRLSEEVVQRLMKQECLVVAKLIKISLGALSPIEYRRSLGLAA
jgi:hypothetical protein